MRPIIKVCRIFARRSRWPDNRYRHPHKPDISHIIEYEKNLFDCSAFRRRNLHPYLLPQQTETLIGLDERGRCMRRYRRDIQAYHG